jgi:Cu/Ag efflux protein CusF
MRRLAFVTRLLFGLFGSMALIVAPATLAVAQEGKQHEMIKGEVENVDASVGKITRKHGPIKSLGMDQGMTMVFSIVVRARRRPVLQRRDENQPLETISRRLRNPSAGPRQRLP